MNYWFLAMCGVALERRFSMLDRSWDWERMNQNWHAWTRPILEAFWHCSYFARMLARYGRELDEAPTMMPSGWAAVLYLYGLR